MLVLIKLSTCPGVTQKYWAVVGWHVMPQALFAVTTAVESKVTHRASVLARRICRVWLPNGRGDLRGIGLCRRDCVTIDRPSLDAGCSFR